MIYFRREWKHWKLSFKNLSYNLNTKNQNSREEFPASLLTSIGLGGVFLLSKELRSYEALVFPQQRM